MLLTNNFLNVWELSHRLSNKRPNIFTSIVIPPDVKDNLRLLINEIFKSDLRSTLIMDKWYPDSDFEPSDHVRYYIDDIEDCIAGKRFNRSLMKFIYIDKMDFLDWCERSSYPTPDFWFTDKDIEDVNEPIQVVQSVAEIKPSKPRTSQIIKRKCQETAIQLWKDHPDMKITPMSKHEQIIQICTTSKGTYKPKTRREWVQEVAPPHIKGKPGRPKNTT